MQSDTFGFVSARSALALGRVRGEGTGFAEESEQLVALKSQDSASGYLRKDARALYEDGRTSRTYVPTTRGSLRLRLLVAAPIPRTSDVPTCVNYVTLQDAATRRRTLRGPLSIAPSIFAGIYARYPPPGRHSPVFHAPFSFGVACHNSPLLGK